TAGDFSRAYAAAIADQNVRDFRRQLRRKRLLVIDDVHRLGESTHNALELRHTLDAIGERGGLVLLTTNTSLADCSEFGRPLLSRFAGGLTLPIAPPGAAARRELLRQAADAAGCKLDEDALSTLAKGLPAEAPKVLRAAAELRRRSGIRVDGAAAERFVESEQSTSSPPLREILRVVARYHQVPLRVLTSASRKQGVVAARAVAIFLARQLTPLSYAEIGQMLGGRDHTTIMHNYRRIDRELPKDRALQSAVDDLRRLLAP
ncbi:MAG: helix-turn-helix domain-containing protein, partial [Planctomycetota bacterium]